MVLSREIGAVGGEETWALEWILVVFKGNLEVCIRDVGFILLF